VNPGVSPSFIQQFVHLDSTTKSTNVLGHVYKQYTVTPDIDRLLGELFINGGQTPADKEAEKVRASGKVKMERGLVKMEVD
jgi:DNA-directed RNA polymerase III subunit RPC4